MNTKEKAPFFNEKKVEGRGACSSQSNRPPGLRIDRANAGGVAPLVGKVRDDTRAVGERRHLHRPVRGKCIVRNARQLADPAVEAVYISLPNALHREWTIRSLAAGKHVLCEKPIASSAAEAGEMFDAARHSGRLLA